MNIKIYTLFIIIIIIIIIMVIGLSGVQFREKSCE